MFWSRKNHSIELVDLTANRSTVSLVLGKLVFLGQAGPKVSQRSKFFNEGDWKRDFSMKVRIFCSDTKLWSVSTSNFDRQWSYSTQQGTKMVKIGSFNYFGQNRQF